MYTLIICPICHHTHDSAVTECANCGWTPPQLTEEQSVSGSVEPVAGGEPGPDAAPEEVLAGETTSG